MESSSNISGMNSFSGLSNSKWSRSAHELAVLNAVGSLPQGTSHPLLLSCGESKLKQDKGKGVLVMLNGGRAYGSFE